MSPQRFPFVLLPVLLAPLSACATTLPTMRPASTPDAGHVGVSASVQGVAPTGPAGDALDAVRTLDSLDAQPNAAEVLQAAEAGVTLLVHPPAVDGQLSVAVGATDWLEVAGRVTSTGLDASVRVQWLDIGGWAGSVGFGLGGAFGGLRLDRFTEYADVQSYRGLYWDVPITLGYEGGSGGFWFGPRVHGSRTRADVLVCGQCSISADAAVNGRTRFVGAQMGFLVGRRVRFGVELVVGRVRFDGTLEATAQGVTASSPMALGGISVQPALGIVTDF